MDAPEWNTDALGPTKRALRRPAAAPAGAAVGAGRGAAIRAWASSIPASSCRAGRCTRIGARDGEPVWRDPALLASDDDTRQRDRGGRRALRRARWPSGCRSIPALVIPAYEDIHYYLWKRAPPAGQRAGRGRQAARPAGARAAGAGVRPGPGRPGRQRAAAAPRDRRTARAAGSPASGSSATATLFLVPGDSPIGLRLPLESLPWADPDDDRARLRARSVRAARAPARRARRCATARAGRRGRGDRATSARCRRTLPVVGRERPGRGAHRAGRRSRATACCTSSSRRSTRPRTGSTLTAAVEDTAAEIGRKVVLEGYLPPRRSAPAAASPSPPIPA